MCSYAILYAMCAIMLYYMLYVLLCCTICYMCYYAILYAICAIMPELISMEMYSCTTLVCFWEALHTTWIHRRVLRINRHELIINIQRVNFPILDVYMNMIIYLEGNLWNLVAVIVRLFCLMRNKLQGILHIGCKHFISKILNI